MSRPCRGVQFNDKATTLLDYVMILWLLATPSSLQDIIVWREKWAPTIFHHLEGATSFNHTVVQPKHIHSQRNPDSFDLDFESIGCHDFALFR